MFNKRQLLVGLCATGLLGQPVAAEENRASEGLRRYFNLIHGEAGRGDRDQVTGEWRQLGFPDRYEMSRTMQDGSEVIETIELGRGKEGGYVRLAFGKAVASKEAATGFFVSAVERLEFLIGADGALRAVEFVPERRRGLSRPEVETVRALEGEDRDIALAPDGARRREAWVAQVDGRRRALRASGLLPLHGFGR